MTRYAEVRFSHLPVDLPLTYAVPESLAGSIEPGMRVAAPLGKSGKEKTGFVTAVMDCADPDIDYKEIIRAVDDFVALSPDLLELTHWISQYYICSWGEAMRAAFPFPDNIRPKLMKSVFLSVSREEALAHANEIQSSHPEGYRLLTAIVKAAALVRPKELLDSVGVTRRFLTPLIKDGYVEEGFKPVRRVPMDGGGIHAYEKPELNVAQRDVYHSVIDAVNRGENKRFLLHGVTGSGKTEIYLRLIERVLELGKSSLVLVPEIGLTPQAADRYRSRFGDSVAILHSGLSWGERFDEWCAAKNGTARIVVGTRSAIFAPLQDPALIIVDEEHDHSYKQDDPSPRYNARDVAAYRAMQLNAVSLFGSATPSLESYANARKGKYELLQLPERAVKHGLPDLELVDMRERGEEETIISGELLQACRETLGRGEQAILFLNRRGFSTTMVCRHCGETIMCERCSIGLVYHQGERKLRCHHCGYSRNEPQQCPSCGHEWLRYKGVGTEQVVDAVCAQFPEHSVERMDADSTRAKGSYNKIFSGLIQRDIDILVGTQMIAKGMDFPGVTLVGVISADMALFFQQFRTAEETFALLTQVAGRAGRGEGRGKVLVQTYCPYHYSIQAAMTQNYPDFFHKEMKYRRLLDLPPYKKLVNIRLSGKDELAVRTSIFDLSSALRKTIRESEAKEVRLLGPSECPIYKINNKYRWHIAMAGKNQENNMKILHSPEVHKRLHPSKKDIKIVIDIDPINLL